MTSEGRGPKPRFDESRLVPLARVEDRIAAGEIVNALRQAGIEAEWREPRSGWFDGLEREWMGKQYGQIIVLDANLERAREIVERMKGCGGAEAPPTGVRLPPE